MENNNLIPEQESAVIENDTCASSLHENIVRRTIGKTTYIANLHFKEQGQTFSQKLKRVLKAEKNNILTIFYMSAIITHRNSSMCGR